MPSVGRSKKLWVFALAAAISAVTASAAAASDVWVWACHDPSGNAMAAEYKTSTGGGGAVVPVSGGCASDATKVHLNAQSAGSWATLTFPVPAGMTASSVRVLRTGSGDGKYTLTTDGGQTLETAVSGSEATFATPAGAGAVTFRVECDACSNAALEVAGVGFLVDDTAPPTGGVNWNNPVDKWMHLTVSASDDSAGLDRAEVVIEEAPQLAKAARFGECAKPPDALENWKAPWGDGPPPPGWSCLHVDTSTLPEGIYHRTVRAYDTVGNAAVLLDRQAFEIWHPVLGGPTQTLSIGSSGVDTPQPNPSPPPGGGVGGEQASSCRTPRLSVSLESKPLRVSRGRPVLLAKKRYRFEGRLTCVVNGKRRSAPKGTRISVLNKVGRKTVSKPATRLRAGGKLKLVLKTPNVSGKRTLIFRYRNASGQRAQVSIPVTITKRAPKR